MERGSQRTEAHNRVTTRGAIADKLLIRPADIFDRYASTPYFVSSSDGHAAAGQFSRSSRRIAREVIDVNAIRKEIKKKVGGEREREGGGKGCHFTCYREDIEVCV